MRACAQPIGLLKPKDGIIWWEAPASVGPAVAEGESLMAHAEHFLISHPFLLTAYGSNWGAFANRPVAAPAECDMPKSRNHFASRTCLLVTGARPCSQHDSCLVPTLLLPSQVTQMSREFDSWCRTPSHLPCGPASISPPATSCRSIFGQTFAHW